MMGEVLEVAKDMETRSYREPLGVVAAIRPFSKSLKHCSGNINSFPRLPGHDSSLVYSDCNSYR